MRCGPIVVVLGASAAEVRATAQLGAVTIVENEGWKAGMGSSLRVGLEALGATDADATIVLLVDTPGVTPAAVRRVAEKSGRDVLAAATYGQRRGHPVLLGRDHWGGVAMLASADVGAAPTSPPARPSQTARARTSRRHDGAQPT
jgi:nicotine blue oxidoreductase